MSAEYGSAPHEPFAVKEDGRCEEPHENPGWKVRPEEYSCQNGKKPGPIVAPGDNWPAKRNGGLQVAVFVCHFCIHRIHGPNKKARYDSFPPSSFRILSPSFTNLGNAFVGQERTCAYHAVVVSKNSASFPKRSFV